MEFRIADTLTDSLTRLTADEQKLVKTNVFDLQMDPSSPGLQFHKLNKAKDKRFSSLRAGSDIRLIVHRAGESLLLCYAGHHDQAYEWGERRVLETHPTTGAAQLVEVRETVREVEVPLFVEAPAGAPRLFAHLSDDELLSYGVPPEWLADARAATEDTIFDLTPHLPGRSRGGAGRVGDGRGAARPGAGAERGRPVRAPGRPAAVPAHDERRGARAGA